ncbi:MAG: hypothetical protein K9L28_07045 [Synergistales bacterium]|nr:hypothetical protein [Synergistales bacterium]
MRIQRNATRGLYPFMAIAAAVLFLLGGTVTGASAEEIEAAFATVTADFSAGTVGTVTRDDAGDYSVNAGEITNLGGDITLHTFDHDGKRKLMVCERSVEGSDKVSIYDPASLEEPEANPAIGNNIYDAVARDGHLYLANFGVPTSVTKHDIENGYTEEGSCSLASPEGSDFKRHVGALFYEEDHLYAVAEVSNYTTFAHHNGLLFKIDPATMEVVESTDIGAENPMGAALYDGNLYIAAMGGAFGSGSVGSVVKAQLPDMTCSTVADGSNLPEGETYNSIFIAHDGTTFLGTYQNADWFGEYTFRHTTVEALEEGDAPTAIDYPLSSLFTVSALDPEEAQIWAPDNGTGEGDGELVVLGTDGAAEIFPETQLDSLPYSVAFIGGVDHSGGGDDDGGGGGCNAAGFAPAFLLLLVPGLALFLKR